MHLHQENKRQKNELIQRHNHSKMNEAPPDAQANLINQESRLKSSNNGKKEEEEEVKIANEEKKIYFQKASN